MRGFLTLVFGVWAGLAQAEIATCYSLDYPQGEIGDMVMNADGDITYSLKDQPYILYYTGCALYENDTNRCSIDCDGGNMSVTHSSKGVDVSAGIRVESGRFDSILNGTGWEADGAFLDGQFFLTPAAPEVCASVESRLPPISLQAGDVHSMVASLERPLAAGGYLLAGPDTIFDGNTRAAVQAYQADAGLEATGVADFTLLRRLGIEAMLAFGGC